MTDKKPRGRPKVENAKTPTERKRASRAAQREATRAANLVRIAASLVRCQAALAREVKSNPQSWGVAVFEKHIASLMKAIGRLTPKG